jgi:hypothetical protein
LKPAADRKMTVINLDGIRCCVQQASGYLPTDKAIWTSIRSQTIPRVTRNFLWKCIHNTFRLGDFWYHIEELRQLADCPHFNTNENLEHIMLDCDAPGQRQIWALCAKLWGYKWGRWPQLNWGLLLGCNLVKFRSGKGKLNPANKDCLRYL